MSLLTWTTFIPLQVMLESLRVVELRSFLASMGTDKKGLKKELVERAEKLLKDRFCPELFSVIKELRDRRYPKKTSSSRHSEIITMPTAVKAEDDYPMKSNGPAHKHEVHLIKLPFYQTLETIVAPVSLGTAAESLCLKKFMSHHLLVCF